MSDTMSTVATDADGPRPLSDAELALTRRGTGDPAPPGAVPTDVPVDVPEPAEPPTGGRPSLEPGAPAGDGLVEATVLAVFSAGWVYLDGTGWRRLGGPGLASVAAAARGSGARVMVRLGPDGTVTEMYVW